MQTKTSALFCILLACSLLILPLSWLFAAILAALWHEVCHMAAIRLFSKTCTPLRLFAYGAKMELPPMGRSQELLCALAGPMGGLLLIFFARWIPRTAVCAAFQSLYNLLPVYPLDGGRAISCLLAIFLKPPAALRLIKWIERLCMAALFLFSLYTGVLWKLGVLPIILCVILFLRVKIVKMPCKVDTFRVQ